MSNDLVKRLRDSVNELQGSGFGPIMDEAADRIEELEAYRVKALKFLDDLWDSGDYFAGELNDLRKELIGDKT